MPDTAKVYGLVQDRWRDARLNVFASTAAAADALADLHRRFGSWDLAMAGYNMGYGGVLSTVRRYNTNDYWSLSRLEGSFPWETTLYVPKVLAASVVMRNLSVFGYQNVVLDSPIEGDDLVVGPGVSLGTVAHACGVPSKEIEVLNPDLRVGKTPPSNEDSHVLVPAGKAPLCAQGLSKVSASQPPVERYVVRFGETLEHIAQSRHVTVAKLIELNAIAPGESVRGGTVLWVPRNESDRPVAVSLKSSEKPVVVVPAETLSYPGRRRLFYRVQSGDAVGEVCESFNVTADELRRWNDIDLSARLVEGMTLQLFVPTHTDVSKVAVFTEEQVQVIAVGTDEFFRLNNDKGRRRVVVSAKAGDTLETIGRRHGVSTGLMERVNRRDRAERLNEGDRIVVWTLEATGASPSKRTDAETPRNAEERSERSAATVSVRAPEPLPPLP